MEEWAAFHQYSHLMVRPSGPISILAFSSLMQTQIGVLSSTFLVIEFKISIIFNSRLAFFNHKIA